MAEAPGLLIQCVGDALRGDDGVGPAVADRLQTLPLPAGVRISRHWGEGTELMQEWETAPRVLLVDAASSGAAPGSIHRFDPHRQPLPAGFRCYASHAFGVAEALELARSLGRLPQRIELIAIEGAEFALGKPLSPAVAGVLDRLVEELAASFANTG